MFKVLMIILYTGTRYNAAGGLSTEIVYDYQCAAVQGNVKKMIDEHLQMYVFCIPLREE